MTIRSRTSSYCCLTVNFSGLPKQQCDSRRFRRIACPKVVQIIVSYNNLRAFFCYLMYFFVISAQISGRSLRRDRVNERMRIAGLRWGEAAARAVRRTAKFTCASLSRGRNYFGKRAAAATERKKSENVFDKPSAEPNLFELCRGEKTSAKRTFDCFKSAEGIRFSAVARPTPKSFHRGGF